MMNKTGGSGEIIATRKKTLPGFRPKEKDDDLHLFKEMHKREKDRLVNLLQPVSEDFESNGQNSFYGMAHGKFISENGKNDYDWLKTPPATPLFASLEMESTNAPELVVQRELPIIRLNTMVEPKPVVQRELPITQPNTKSTTGSSGSTIKSEIETSKAPTSKGKVIPRHTTRNSRLSTTSTENKNIKSEPILNHKINQSYTEHKIETPKKTTLITTTKPIDKKETKASMNMLASNLNKSIGLDSTTKPKTKPISLQLPPEISDVTPPNLKTDRIFSVSRARPTNQTPSFTRKLEPIMPSSRVSSSHSVSRARKQEMNQNTSKEKAQEGNKTLVMGSRMVDRVMNARSSSSEENKSKVKLNSSMNEGSNSRRGSIHNEDRQSKIKFNSSLNEPFGFGRLMSKSSLDMALKHMDFKMDSSVAAKNQSTTGRRSVSVSKRRI